MNYIRKEQMLADVERIYSSQHYLMVDDKLRILNAMKEIWGESDDFFPATRRYALDPGNIAALSAG